MHHSSNRPLMRLARAALLLWLALPALANAETLSAAQWLDRLAHSMDELNYRGVMSYAYGDQLESLQITHGIYKGEQFERVEHLDGARREIIRHGSQLTCIQLGQRLELLFHRHLLKAGLKGLDQYYTLTVDGTDRVAGRHAVVLSIKPRDQYRFGYQLALDSDSGLLLRSEAIDPSGKVRERLQFVQVEIGMPLKKEWLGDAPDKPVARNMDQSGDRMIDRVLEESQMPWQPDWVPPGFALSVAPSRKNEGVMTYSDGLAVMSVFVEPIKPPLPTGDGRATQGATIAYTRLTEHDGKPYLVTVVGEVPEVTAQRVASSVVWHSSQ